MTAALEPRLAEVPHIAAPQLIYGLPALAYHAMEHALSCTGLKNFARSPRHYYARHLDPERWPAPERAGQLEGSMLHCAVLEPAEFARRYVVGPETRRGTKVWDAFEASLQPGQIGVKREQYDVAWAQAQSLRALPDVATLLSSGRAETSAFWIDEASGVLCRCRPDWTHHSGPGAILLDLKTAGSADPDEFARHAAAKRYDLQAAFYSDGYAAASGMRVLAFIFGVVESEWPFAAAAYVLPDDWLAYARQRKDALLARFAECRRTGTWPGYSEAIETLPPPSWLAREIERDEAVAF